ncbi:MAG: tetratricopeptide repeat protein, partial [Terriglobia bacterium]
MKQGLDQHEAGEGPEHEARIGWRFDPCGPRQVWKRSAVKQRILMNDQSSSFGARRFLQLALLAVVVCLAAQWAPAATHRRATTSKRARAQAAYTKATRLYQRLKATSPLRRTGEDYKRVVLGFEQVFKIDPSYVKAPAALAAAAHTYEEMGLAYADDPFYSRAISAYQFLIQQYPGGSAAREAQYAIARIYLIDLENPDEARTAFQQYLKTYPKSPQAKLAKREIERINARLARHRATVK